MDIDMIALTLAPVLTIALTLVGGASPLTLDAPAIGPTRITLVPAGPLVLTAVAELLRGLTGPQGEMGAPGATGPAGGIELSYTAEQALSGHLAITLDTLGRALPADCTLPGHAAVMGITLGAAAAGGAVAAAITGQLEHLGWAFTPGVPVLLGRAGALTQALPPGAAFTKVLALAVTPTRISLDFGPAIFL